MKLSRKKESPPAGNYKRRTAHDITCPSIPQDSHPRMGVPHLEVPSVLTWLEGGTQEHPHPDLRLVAGISPGKDIAPVEVLWDGDGVPPSPLGVNRNL